jgi:phage gp46-like protein
MAVFEVLVWLFTDIRAAALRMDAEISYWRDHFFQSVGLYPDRMHFSVRV